MQANLEHLNDRSIGRLLWDYSAPAVAGMLVTSLNNIIDRIFIGQGVGPEAIAGLGVTFPVMNLSAALGVLIGAGASARTSIMLGGKDFRSAERVLGNSLVMTLIIGILYVTLFGVFIDDILYAFGASDLTIPYARDFMLFMLPGMFLTNLCFNLNNIMRASGYPMRAMFTMIISAVLNVILAPIFIFVFDLGIKGAAIATSLSLFVSTLFVILHFVRRDSTVRFQKGIYSLSWRIIWQIISIGAAPSFVNIAGCLINITVNNALKDYGSDIYIGAASIFNTYTMFIVTFLIGLGMGMQPIVGYNYGAGKLDRLKQAYKLTVGIASAICIVGCAFGIMFPELIARTFTSDPELIQVTARGVRIGVVMLWVVGFQTVSTSFFQSIGKAGKSILLSLLRQVIFLYPLLRILPEYFGLDGVWMSYPISDGLATIVTIILVVWQFHQIKRMAQSK